MMKKILTILLAALPILASAQTKGVSIYGFAGYGGTSVCDLKGLTMSQEDLSYFKSRGLTPTYLTEGEVSHSYNFGGGLSYNFNNWWRLSLQGSTQYVDQNNYHAINADLDLLLGVNLLGKTNNHGLYFELGPGASAYLNNYTYQWEGIDSQTGEVIETRDCDLGEHNSVNPSAVSRLYYEYNLFHRTWIGAYIQGRYNFTDGAFAPKVQASAGVQARVSFARTKTRTQKVSTVLVPQYLRDTVVLTRTDYKIIHDTVTVAPTKIPNPKLSVYFEQGSASLSEANKSLLANFVNENEGLLFVLGNCSSEGSEMINEHLSIQRARTVFDYIKSLGVDDATILYGGSSADRAQTSVAESDRRVDLILIQ